MPGSILGQREEASDEGSEGTPPQLERRSQPNARLLHSRRVAAGVRLFAYGSNMCAGKLALAAKGATFVDIAILPRHDLRFHKRSDDGSGKADAYLTDDPAHVVWGIIVDVPASSWDSLVRSEGGYREVDIEVAAPAAGKVACKTFIAKPERIQPGLKPYRWYKRYIVEGARAHNLPTEYVTRLDAFEPSEDPDPSREAKHAAVGC